MITANAAPNPGSPEAVEKGCLCPVLDNRHGEGLPTSTGTTFWLTGGCPLHAPFASPPRPETNAEPSGRVQP